MTDINVNALDKAVGRAIAHQVSDAIGFDFSWANSYRVPLRR